jgi:hypothetical protein
VSRRKRVARRSHRHQRPGCTNHCHPIAVFRPSSVTFNSANGILCAACPSGGEIIALNGTAIATSTSCPGAFNVAVNEVTGVIFAVCSSDIFEINGTSSQVVATRSQCPVALSVTVNSASGTVYDACINGGTASVLAWDGASAQSWPPTQNVPTPAMSQSIAPLVWPSPHAKQAESSLSSHTVLAACRDCSASALQLPGNPLRSLSLRDARLQHGRPAERTTSSMTHPARVPHSRRVTCRGRVVQPIGVLQLVHLLCSRRCSLVPLQAVRAADAINSGVVSRCCRSTCAADVSRRLHAVRSWNRASDLLPELSL